MNTFQAMQTRSLVSDFRALLVVTLLALATLSCSDSDDNQNNAVNPVLDDPAGQTDDTQDIADDTDQDDTNLFDAYTETGNSGMRVTYQPVSLTALTNVEELENVYAEVMSCVGLSTAGPPDMLLTTDESYFYQRVDGTDVYGYYNTDLSSVIVYADDLDASLANQYWWTRHGMILYLIEVYDLPPDSIETPYSHCHWGAG